MSNMKSSTGRAGNTGMLLLVHGFYDHSLLLEIWHFKFAKRLKERKPSSRNVVSEANRDGNPLMRF